MFVGIAVFLLLVTPFSVYSICDIDESSKTQYQENICSQTKLVGSCKLKIKRFYFNAKAKQCEKFFYEGCKGNRNNFKTEGKKKKQFKSTFIIQTLFLLQPIACVNV